MHARSALFDVYGDHLRARGGAAPVAALVRLLAPLGIAAPSVRTSLSRMVRQGWLARESGVYHLTPKARTRLDDTAARIYRTTDRPWDGRWHLLAIATPTARADRQRLAASLAFLGYGAVDGGTWISPYASPEVTGVLAEFGVAAEEFAAVHQGTPGLAARAWDLDSLATAYKDFVPTLEPHVCQVNDLSTEEDAFAARSHLVHAWRTFLFRDPGLPPELLPPGWAGEGAREFFDHHAARLRPAADRFVDSCLRRPT